LQRNVNLLTISPHGFRVFYISHVFHICQALSVQKFGISLMPLISHQYFVRQQRSRHDMEDEHTF
jgi:hypothetical protein